MTTAPVTFSCSIIHFQRPFIRSGRPWLREPRCDWAGGEVVHMWNSTPVAVAPLVGLLGICSDLPHVTAKALSLLPAVCAKHPCAVTLPHSSDGLSYWMNSSRLLRKPVENRKKNLFLRLCETTPVVFSQKCSQVCYVTRRPDAKRMLQ